MPFTIPSEVFNDYFEVCDELINNPAIGKDVILYYPETITQVTDTSHTLNLVDGPPTNFGPDGNLNNFERMGGGTSYSKVENTETIRCRLYMTQKDWNKLGVIAIPEVKAMMITKIVNWEKIVRANQIGVEFAGTIQRYVLSSQMQPWGFMGSDGADRYLLAQLKEV